MKARPSHISEETVLVVDDEAFIRLMLIDTFEEAGFRALEASNASEAIEILTTPTINVELLISDIRMPGELNGLDLADWARKNRPAMKVLLMSAYFEGQHLAPGHAHQGFLRKPFMPPEMLALAQSALNKRP